MLTFVDKSNPAASFVMNTRMPNGNVANMLSTLKLTNAIRLSECAVTEEGAIKAGGIGPAIKNMNTSVNERYYRLMDNFRAVQTAAIITEPDVDHARFPAFRICEGKNDATLTKKDFGRG